MLKQIQTDTGLTEHRLDLAVETIDRQNSELRQEHGKYLDLLARHTALAAAARGYLADPHGESRSRLEFLLIGAPK